MTSSLYRVETQPVRVEVSFGVDARALGEMFLRPSIVSLSGVESIADRMNDRDAFFPLRVSEPTAQTVLIGKTQVRYVAADGQPLPDELSAAPAGETRAFHVTVELDDAQELSGVFHALLSPGQRRALDLMNSNLGLFVPLFVASRQYVINRSFIRRLHETAG